MDYQLVVVKRILQYDTFYTMLRIRDVYTGSEFFSGLFIRNPDPGDPDFLPIGIPDPVAKKAQDPGSLTLLLHIGHACGLPVIDGVPGVQDLEEEGERLDRGVEVHHVDQLVHRF